MSVAFIELFVCTHMKIHEDKEGFCCFLLRNPRITLKNTLHICCNLKNKQVLQLLN